MTETQITFADINVGDKIRSVSPCGTERVGVAKFVTGTYVDDAEGLTIAEPSWTIYRLTPPAPPEPDWFGYVGYVTSEKGIIRHVYGKRNGLYLTVRVDCAETWGYGDNRVRWPDILTLGTFTAVKP